MDAFRSFQLGATGAGLDLLRQDFAGKAGEITNNKLAQAAKAVTSQATWGPIVACGMYAAIKVAEGNPGEIVQGVEVRRNFLRIFDLHSSRASGSGKCLRSAKRAFCHHLLWCLQCHYCLNKQDLGFQQVPCLLS